MEQSDYMTREEALKFLNVKASTLYTYVSRGLVRSVRVESQRSKLFSRADLDRLRTRSKAHSGVIARSEGSMHWGAPIVSTSIIEILPEGPVYRGFPAIELASNGTSFEATAELLWSGQMPDDRLLWRYRTPEFSPDALVGQLGGRRPIHDVLKVFAAVVLALGVPPRGQAALRSRSVTADAQQIITVLAGCCGYLTKPGSYVPPKSGERMAATMARAFGIKPSKTSVDSLTAALILCADLELAPGTFTARIAASAGSDLHGCIAAGLCAHDGALTGRGTDKVEALFGLAGRMTSRGREAMMRGGGRAALGFNHPLFPTGDPRAYALMDLTRKLPVVPLKAEKALSILEEAAEQGAFPGVGVGLVILALGLGLPRRSALAIWAIARIAGQTAHVVEQRMHGGLLRPRARFVLAPPA